MRVAIIGGGPVGLVSAAVLAGAGHDVRVVDIDPVRTDKISRGVPPFHEPGLPELLRAVVDNGKLTATGVAADAVVGAEVILICVGTPPTGNGADLSALRAASAEVGKALRAGDGYRVVAVKSTVPPGYHDLDRRADPPRALRTRCRCARHRHESGVPARRRRRR